MKRLFSFLSIFAILLISSCETPRTALLQDSMAVREFAPPEPLKPTDKESVEPRKDFREIEKENTLSLTLKDADIRDILFLLSKESTMPIVPDKDVEGKVSIDIKDRPIGEILYAILKPLGYTAYVDEGVIRVGKPQLISRTFYLNYIKDKRSSTSTTNASITASGGGGVTTQPGISLSVSTGAPTATSGTSSSQQSGNVNVTTSGVSDFWSEVIRGLEVIVFGDTSGKKDEHGFSRGDKTGKKLIVNEMAGVVFVTDYPDNIERVRSFLNDIERAVKRQVMIQAHIVEVSLDDNYSLGLNWNLILGYEFNKGQIDLSQSLLSGAIPGDFQGKYVITRADKHFEAIIDAMKRQGQTNILSSPKISTMNNQKAVIKLTTREVSWISNTIFNAEGKVLVNYTTPQVDEVGIFLDVTPYISEDGLITMQIHPSISEVTKTSLSPDRNSSKPIIDMREIDTMITVKNGQTIVIAGLIVDKIMESRRSLPVLGNIPVIGNLFSNTAQDKRKSELVILLTPFILDDRTVEDIAREHKNRLYRSESIFSNVPK